MSRSPSFRAIGALAALVCTASISPAAELLPRQFSGIFPHLSVSNDLGECGTGGVVPWAGKLWVITYGPHQPKGSTDKLYEIDPTLSVTVRPESVGGTPACRLIHRESGQLFIGPYAIGQDGAVRVIPPKVMPGRLTGLARHLTDPAGKVYYATMEEGFYEVDVKSLAVTELFKDGNFAGGKDIGGDLLPGYHGKGLASGQGRLVYANNGENTDQARHTASTISGALAEWEGPGHDWSVVRRNQFTDVSGPGGIEGNAHPATDPLWSIGWDHRSLILMLLDGGKWSAFRLPKASHSYDGAHGWNTEWPRIRDIGAPGQPDCLMTMHGTFWHFPPTFSATNTAGIAPRSNYLKVIGDFSRWTLADGTDRVVFGCDDAAANEFMNKRAAKGSVAGPGRSQSNLWFTAPGQIDRLGPVIGRGAVWQNDAVKAGAPSDPFLFSGYERRGVHLAHDATAAVKFTFEVDRDGTGSWQPLREMEVPAAGYTWVEFPASERGEWVRVRTDRDVSKATAFFHFSNTDHRTGEAAPLIAGLAKPDEPAWSGGIVRAGGDKKAIGPLQFAAAEVRNGKVASEGYYELGADLKLQRKDDAEALTFMKEKVAPPVGALKNDAASVLYVDEAGRRFRLPKGDAAFDADGPVRLRTDREVVTERDLFQSHGTFFELPSEMTGGFAKIRPVATHGRRITDFCSWRGMLVLAGLAAEGAAENPHVVRSDDGRAAVWLGAIDDLWQFGKPTGHGGPWKDSPVRAGTPSDAYLLTGYDRRTLTLSHDGTEPVAIRVEVDISGEGDWRLYRTFDVAPRHEEKHVFPEAFAAYWLRVVAARDCRATAWLDYE